MSDKLPACRGFWLWATQEDIDKLEACRTFSPDKLKHNGEFRKVNVKIRREGAAAKTRRGYYDK